MQLGTRRAVTFLVFGIVATAFLIGLWRANNPGAGAQTPAPPTEQPGRATDGPAAPTSNPASGAIAPAADAAPQPAAEPATTLQRVRANGHLRCGVDSNSPGFSMPADASDALEEREVVFVDFATDYGNFVGFDAEFCKVIATAVFPDTADSVAARLRFIPVSTLPPTGGAPVNERFRVLTTDDEQARVDVLVRSTTWTAARDTNLKADNSGYEPGRVDFGPVIYHDAQRFIIKWPASSAESPALEDLDGRIVCVGQGTTHANNFSSLATEEGEPITPNPRVVADDALRRQFLAECDAVTADTSRLLSEFGDLLAEGSDFALIGAEVSREPLAPVIREGDSQWKDIVSYAIYVTFYAVELGLSQDNVEAVLAAIDQQDGDAAAGSTIARLARDTRVQKLLGRAGSLGSDLGLDQEFALRILRRYGNYEEIYLRHLNEPFNLDNLSEEEVNSIRGPNRSWRDGGNLISPPF